MRQPAVYSYGIKHRKWERDHRPTEKQATYLTKIGTAPLRQQTEVLPSCILPLLLYLLFLFVQFTSSRIFEYIAIQYYPGPSKYSLFQTASTTTILKHYCALARKCTEFIIVYRYLCYGVWSRNVDFLVVMQCDFHLIVVIVIFCMNFF
jgi:hypothetical protein